MKWLYAVGLAAIASVANAAPVTVTVDFQEFATGQIGETGAPTTISSKGYLFSSENNFYAQDRQGDLDTSLVFCPCATLTVAKQDGNPFALHSFDLLLWGPPAATSDFTITGYYAAGGSVMSTIANVNQTDTYVFDSAWHGLDSFVINYDVDDVPKNIDNVVVSGVPIPAAVWLFGSALAGLGVIKRKRAA